VFQEHFAHRLPDKLTEVPAEPQPSDAGPVRILCEDESRVGLLPIQRRRLTVSGVKPRGPVHYQFENFYGYGTVEPTTGESFCLELPYLHTANFQILLNEFAAHDQDTLNMVLMDHGNCHQAKSLLIPSHVACLCLPPYRPELNPIERWWQDMTAQLAWVLAAQIDELEHRVALIIRQYSKAARHSLTASPYFVQAVNALCT
jgi:transposase